MKALTLGVILSSSLCIFSCSTTQKSATIGVEDVKKSGFVMAKPQLAEITVDNQKIEGRAVINNKLYRYSEGGPSEAAMNLAVIDATKKASCDIIVQPVYEIEKSGNYTTAVVRGFAGRYKAFREITQEDVAAFKTRYELDNTTAVKYRNNNVELSNAAPPKHKGGAGKAILIGLGVVVLGGLIGLAATGGFD